MFAQSSQSMPVKKPHELTYYKLTYYSRAQKKLQIDCTKRGQGPQEVVVVKLALHETKTKVLDEKHEVGGHHALVPTPVWLAFRAVEPNRVTIEFLQIGRDSCPGAIAQIVSCHELELLLDTASIDQTWRHDPHVNHDGDEVLAQPIVPVMPKVRPEKQWLSCLIHWHGTHNGRAGGPRLVTQKRAAPLRALAKVLVRDVARILLPCPA